MLHTIIAVIVIVVVIVLTVLFLIYAPPLFFIKQLSLRHPDVIFYFDQDLIKSRSEENTQGRDIKDVILPETTAPQSLMKPNPISSSSIPREPALFPPPTKRIALTIDDSPSPNTLALLNVLEKMNCTATFFIIGSFVKSPKDLESIVTRGHQLGNHGMNDYPSWRLTDSEFEKELLEVDALLFNKDMLSIPQNQQRYMPKLFRPGHGFFSKRMTRTVQKHGYKLALGSVYPHDAAITNVALNTWYVVSRAKNGDVIVLHDREHTIECLAKSLFELKTRGFEVCSLGKIMDGVEKVK